MAKEPQIDELHRKKLLKFLLLKTTAVRCGIKPGELLRVRHCYATTNAEGFRFCLRRQDIYETLNLSYIELKVEARSSLALFYNPATLAQTLARPATRDWLTHHGYPADATTLDALLAVLKSHFKSTPMAHEVGLFIGYPLKDVDGFVRARPATPLHRGLWRVYGELSESLRRMRLYSRVEQVAQTIYDSTRDVRTFLARTQALPV